MSDLTGGSLVVKGGRRLKRLYLESRTCRMLKWDLERPEPGEAEPPLRTMDVAGGSLVLRALENSRVCRWAVDRFKEGDSDEA